MVQNPEILIIGGGEHTSYWMKAFQAIQRVVWLLTGVHQIPNIEDRVLQGLGINGRPFPVPLDAVRLILLGEEIAEMEEQQRGLFVTELTTNNCVYGNNGLCVATCAEAKHNKVLINCGVLVAITASDLTAAIDSRELTDSIVRFAAHLGPDDQRQLVLTRLRNRTGTRGWPRIPRPGGEHYSPCGADRLWLERAAVDDLARSGLDLNPQKHLAGVW